MSYEAEVKLRKERRKSLVECLLSIIGIEMRILSHLEVNVRSGRDIPGVELVDCDGVVGIHFLVGGASG